MGDLKVQSHGGNLEILAPHYGFKIGEIIDFSANLNPYGSPPEADSLFRGALKDFAHYPDPDYSKLKRTLAKWEAVAEREVTVGNGASELIFWCSQLQKSPRALILGPTFTEYEKSVLAADGTVHYSLAKEEDSFQHNFSADIAAWNYDLVFLANPNNPTGSAYSSEVLKEWIMFYRKKFSETVFIIDESFIPFVANGDKYSLNSLATKTPGIVVLHSLTKIFSLPGMRLGYAVGHADSIGQLEKILPTWRINSLAQKFGESLFSFAPYLGNSLVNLYLDKEIFFKELHALPGFKVFNSACNFFLLKGAADLDILSLKEFLAHRGLFIRDCNDFVGLEKNRFIRLAVRRREENGILTEAIREFLENGS